MNWYKDYCKPICDFLLATFLLITLAPVLFIIYLINRITFSKGMFQHIRIGKNEKPFVLFKFRSMLLDGEEKSIPKWGKFLRISSLDELPQLINVLRGEMSFVGPRPLLPEYLDHYNREQRLRHNVKPGITGLAQTNGRNKLDWKESLALDSKYAQNCSLRLDISILLNTIPQLFKFNDVNEKETVSRKPFKGEGT